jgi:glyoxylase-like metal-dependent hydrolase (beta-lactamase superfamily II)
LETGAGPIVHAGTPKSIRSTLGRTADRFPDLRGVAMPERGKLSCDVFVAKAKPFVSHDLPPGVPRRTWPATTATLISGQRDAVLVDAMLTVRETMALAEAIAATGKNLTTIYATHGHGDHFFGLSVLMGRFPHVRAFATPAVVEHMREQASPEYVASFWNPGFPLQLPDPLVIAEPLPGDVIDLEGNDLVVVNLGHTDTDDTTCLYVPATGTVVAGDAAYNDVHPHLSETSPSQRQEWIAALDTMESLRPRMVVAGHKREGAEDHPRIIEETRQYIRNFDQAARKATTPPELYEQMVSLYPDRLNPGALWDAARAAYA